MIRRLCGWLLDRISGDYELDVEPANHPYYPGEALDQGGQDASAEP